MELFYSKTVSDGGRVLDAEESGHCVKVLRHRRGDTIHVVDGHGMLYDCTITDADPRAVAFEINRWVENYGSHDYWLEMAVCPPKNIDRFEWFSEKATEIGVDRISPLFGDYSERKVFKPERIERLLVSAAKQSHKGAIPELAPATTVKEFLQQNREGLKLICYCDEATGKMDIKEVLSQVPAQSKITIIIGPEGDFSRAEVALAIERGWQPVSLGDSRLRIETAAIVAAAAVYLHFSH
ncbi:MAG: 16S rRNA (uracil(1498)-N(3))-methyltransferase [Bacteroidales bacterium]|nr:16S rRNA (uracil(1498)-N(3))-methyltransferase [Bacteroidales bacterium]MBR6868905.1 16S rRNA (uracil(1498)-N(3))-methyltransferase [Bacteroidales bacterium]